MNAAQELAPLYARVEATLASEIAGAALTAGSRLPPEESLIERFGVSRNTVRRAIEHLIARGLVEIRRGKGAFVCATKIRQDLAERTGFAEDMIALDRTPTAKLLHERPVPANAAVAAHLSAPVRAQVYRMERTRLADGIAISFDETDLPLEIGQKIASDDLEADPIFSLLEYKYDLQLVEAQYQVEAVTADERVAQALDIAAGSPIFLIVRTSYCDGQRLVNYEKPHYRGDLIKFVTRLSRRPRQKL